MFETAELGRTLDKKTFADLEPKLRVRLLDAQERVRAARLPVHVLISGVDGAGKGETVNLLAEWMDPRMIATTAFGPRTDEEEQRPFFWRFWRTLAPKGRVGLYFGSWYTQPIVDRVGKRMKLRDFEHRLSQIEAFERMLVDDGGLIIKLWFHISRKAQRKRIEGLAKDKRTRWRVTEQDLRNLHLYDRFATVSEAALNATSTGQAPWTLIDGEDARYRSVAVAEHLLNAIDKRLAARPALAPVAAPQKLLPAHKTKAKKGAATTTTLTTLPTSASRTILEAVDLSQTVDDEAYDEQLEQLQGRLAATWRQAKANGTSLIVVLEGWDAAGKGGAIRRVTPALDARDYSIIPIAAPTDEEKAQHYLWRFWRHLPRDGRVTIFDRSWYGRVLVERVEKFCSEDAWMRGYDEINAFEEQLVEDNIVVVKLWLHIDQDEQLRRFRERENIQFKSFKIGEEDYRNRGQWDAYLLAVHDMVARTSTTAAPWQLIPANNKKVARLEVLKRLCEALEKQK
ncbi:MAG: polyphosphate:AMP phosphotransferase [Deltaproteobacteria bacterium]|nr:polyphosphate:AMP phosphotransferase [Deltaproteobacteria bacterium]